VTTDLYREGMALLEAGDAHGGVQLLEAAWRAAPDSVERMDGLARALDLLGERTRAQGLWERAHALAPSEPGPACALAMTYLEQQEDARAARVLGPVLEVRPEDPDANLYLAMALAKTEPERARACLALALLHPDPERRWQAEELARAL
jgi:Tfp pilus assembly protein PilF